MKHNTLTLCILLALSYACPILAAKEPKCGGYSPTCVTNKDTIAAATFAVQSHEKAVNTGKEKTDKLELVSILSAETQVVAGLNYKLEFKVKLNGKEKTAKAIVWWQAWRNPDPYQLTSWEWVQEETSTKK
ncbi:MAG: cystatin domain-containing protein [bacterium]